MLTNCISVLSLSSAPIPPSPFVVPETARSSAAPCTSQSDTIKMVDTEIEGAAEDQVTIQRSNTSSMRIIPETAPQRSSNESESPQLPPPPKSPVKIKQSTSDLFDDDDDIFNFDEKEPEKEPTPTKPIKVEEDLDVSKKRKRSSSGAEQTAKVVPPKKPFLGVSSNTPSSSSAKSNENVSPKKQSKSFNGYLCKSYIKSTGASVKSDIPEDELTRSFITLEVRPLVVVKPNNQSVIERSANGDVKNVKRFRKQAVATSFKPISCLSMSQAKPMEKRSTSSREESIEIEDQEENPILSSPTAQSVDEEIDDLWNFDSQSTSRKRKR